MMLATQLSLSAETAPWREAVTTACGRIAPSWPLDQAIAVNPWWNWRDMRFNEVAARLHTQGGVQCLMPGSWYKSKWLSSIKPDHLQQASEELGIKANLDELLASLDDQPEKAGHCYNVADLLDKHDERSNRFAWHEEITQQISQFCGLYFSYPERLQSDSGDNTFYRAWLDVIRQDRGIEVLMAEAGLNAQFRELPDEPDAVFKAMYEQCNSHPEFASYAHSLLLDIHGWASWLAWGGWIKSSRGDYDDGVSQLLAIRMAWDSVLLKHTQTTQPELFESVGTIFNRQFDQQQQYDKFYLGRQRHLWLWQRASEIAYQRGLEKKLANPAKRPQAKPLLQAIFCIDVRSEPMRRALEAQSDEVSTFGFAGFFGLPLEYVDSDSSFRRSQAPGLLTPSIQAQQTQCKKAAPHTIASQLLGAANQNPTAAFGFVEAFGLGKIYSLVKQSWLPNRPTHPVDDSIGEGQWQLMREGKPLSNGEKAELVANVLTNMGLTSDFAPDVLFVGHTCSTTNNPQRAALECGACGGQSGELNARVLAQLLNEPGVRLALQGHGIAIPTATQFHAGVHDTTLDEISCFGNKENKPWHRWLTDAGIQARADRAASLGLSASRPERLGKNYRQLGKDWAQLRPEWGLANNAAFIVAKRDLTRGMNLEGRCFLHDYSWKDDADFKVLEAIMTAPMLVTNWINLQYYASVTDHQRYGSGNKLLHNVVGGNIGVFEGNGGDLRIGLSKQSVHDGNTWRHEPLRLSVYIDAPQPAIAAIIERNADVAQLINNDWLYVFSWDSEKGGMRRYYHSEWQ